MANGNGTLDGNPLWTWIRPVFAILFGALGLVMMGFAGMIALAERDWLLAGGIVTVSLAFLGVAYGIRTIDKILEKGINLTPSPNNQVSPPKVTSYAVVPPTDSGDTAVAGEEQVTLTKPAEATPIPFDEDAFLREVFADTEGKYGVVNNCTVFYEARDKIAGVAAPWKFNNKKALRDAWECVFGLVQYAFKEKWGVTYPEAAEHLNDPRGCTTCSQSSCTYPDLKFKARQLGMDYYAILLDYENTLNILNNLS